MTILIPDGGPDAQQIGEINFWDTQFAREMYDTHLQSYGWKLNVSNTRTVLSPPSNGEWIIRCEKTNPNALQEGFSNPRYIIHHHKTSFFLAFEAEVRGWSTIYRLLCREGGKEKNEMISY